jgi:hypothetical protein
MQSAGSSDASLIFSVLLLLLAFGAAASPLNAFLRFKYFGDGYRWRGLTRRDAIPLTKTVGIMAAFAAGAAWVMLRLVLKIGGLSCFLFGVFVAGLFGTIILSIWHALGKARCARTNCQNT